MPKPEAEILEKTPINIFKDDLDKLRRWYPTVGFNKVIRLLVRRHVKMVEKKLARQRRAGGKDSDLERTVERLTSGGTGGEGDNDQ